MKGLPAVVFLISSLILWLLALETLMEHVPVIPGVLSFIIVGVLITAMLYAFGIRVMDGH